jgi:hypothetical protein
MVMAIYGAGIESQNKLFDELQIRLDKGCYIDHQDGLYWLFYPNGDGLCSGKTIKELLENLTKP